METSARSDPVGHFGLDSRGTYEDPSREVPADALAGRVAIIAGADQGIGRAVALAFAHQGADIVDLYSGNHAAAEETRRLVEATGSRCLGIPGNLADDGFCRRAVVAAAQEFGHLDILVTRTVQNGSNPNLFALFYLTKAVIPYLRPGGSIINSTLATADDNPGSRELASGRAAIIAFTGSLSRSLASRGIRVNVVVSESRTTSRERPGPESKSNGVTRRNDALVACYLHLASDGTLSKTGHVVYAAGCG